MKINNPHHNKIGTLYNIRPTIGIHSLIRKIGLAQQMCLETIHENREKAVQIKLI